MSAALLPPNATPLETALADAIGARHDVAVPVRDLWSPERCPAALLPWLAWALSVDVWDAGWPEVVKREVIAESLDVHRIKGSRRSVERAIAAMGLGDVTIVEGFGANRYNGAQLYDGSQTYGQEGNWAEYRVFVSQLISNRQADAIRASLALTAPARSHLVELNFVEAPLLYDGAGDYDGAFNHGVT